MPEKNDDAANEAAILKAVSARVADEQRIIADAGGTDDAFIRNCLDRNELGDGELYARLHRQEFVYNAAADQWLQWEGHHWGMDTSGRHLAAVENVVAQYEAATRDVAGKLRDTDDDHETAKLESVRKNLYRRIQGLRSSRRRKNCIQFAHTCSEPLAIKGPEIDCNPYALPCANGVIDLKTGELNPGRPDQYLLKASPTTWTDIDAPCPTWESFLMQVMSENKSLVDFIQRALGFSLIGEVMQSVFFVMTGQGRNGKSVMVKAISEVLGPLAAPIQSAMLLDQSRNTNPAAPTPEIMTLRGLRMAFGSETDDGCKISPSRVKWLTGNDRLTGRNPHDKHEVQFEPTHTLFLLTNHKPHAPADDFAFWERMFLIPFELSFVNREPKMPNERKADPLLINKLRDEQSGILAWLVRGCLEYQIKNTLDPPEIVKAAVEEYKRNEDSIADFIDECCYIDDAAETTSAEIYEVFEIWWKRNVSNYIPKIKRFGTWFGKRFTRVKSGKIYYRGVGLTVGPDDLRPGK